MSTVEITGPVREISERFGLDPAYIGRLDIYPDHVVAEIYLGREGRCQGPKYVDRDTGKPAMETLTFKVLT